MSKGNSGILSKHQSKIPYTEEGIIGDSKGYEVFKEVVLRISSGQVNPNHVVSVQGRMSNDTTWYEIGSLKGPGTITFHIASWDYVLFKCVTFDCSGTCFFVSSGYFNDGMFAVDSINNLKNDINDHLLKINDSICKLHEEMYIINRQVELITDHEEDEVK